jgi:tetratricopeptide (TPR) repeat protein
VAKRNQQPKATWPKHAITGAIAFALGSFVTWFVLRPPVHEKPAVVASSNFVPAADPKLPPAQAAVASGNSYYDRKDWAHAAEAYERAIALGVDNADVRTDLGNSYRFSKQPQKALEQYEIAQRENPQHENSLFNQGGLFAFELNQPARALEIWRECLARFPESRNAVNVRQLIAQLEGEQKTQLAEAEKWLHSREQTAAPSPR